MKTKLIHAALFTPLSNGHWGLPLLLWGPPGVAKSAGVLQVARACGLVCKVLPPGQMGEGMFGVTPVPVQNERGETRLAFPPPHWVDTIPARGVIFVDETNTSPPALQAAVMGLFLDRRIGDFYFAPGVRVIGAANPVHQSAGGWDLSPAQANRSAHIDWEKPSAREFGQFLLSRYQGRGTEGLARDAADRLGASEIDPEAEEARVLTGWPTAWAKASGLVSAFTDRRGEAILHKMPAEADPQQSKAWPSHRTWEFATCALAAGEVHGLSEVETDELVRSFVGVGASTELMTFQKAADLPDPAALLDGKVKFTHDPKRADRTMAVLSSAATFVARKDCDKRKARAGVAWQIMDGAVNKQADLAVPAAMILCKAQFSALPEARPILSKLQPILAEIGFQAE